MDPIPTATHLALKYAYGGLVHYRAGDRLETRRLPDFELVLIIEGQVVYQRHGRAHDAGPGSIILAHPGVTESYRWDPQSLTRHAYFHFDIAALPADLPRPARWPVLVSRPSAAARPLFRQIVEFLADESHSSVTVPGPELCCDVECLLRLLVRPRATAGLSTAALPEPVNLALNVMRLSMDRDPHAAITLDDLARQAGVSDKHLCRLFRDALGYPPMKTMQLLRLQLGMALLAQSNLSVQEVADRCGFANPLYFSRCFSATYGQPPTAVRRLLRRGQPPPVSPLPPDISPRVFW